MAAWYRVGTVNVTNGNPSVTGVLTAWISQVKAGDEFVGPDGITYEVAADPTSNTALTLATNYLGATASGQAYAIRRTSTAWSVVADLSLKISNFLTNLVGVFGGSAAPLDSFGSDGSYYFRIDIPGGIAQLYKKASGTWGTPITLLGLQGPVGPGFSTTSTSSNTVGTGTKTFNVPNSGTAYLGARMRAAMTASPSNYVEGIVTAATATSVTINADLIGGSGTSAAWSLVATGNKGDTGAAGPGSTGTSTSSITIGTGTKNFTTQAGLNLIAGQRVRAADQANPSVNFVEGAILSYSGTALSIAVDTIGGSGTIAAWNIGIIGSRGLQGTTGADGVAGPAGASYAGASTTSNTIGTGNKTFTVPAGLAYVVGSRARFADAANPAVNFMEGAVTAYATTSMTIAVDKTGGSGTISSWNMSLAGEVGQTGTAGTNGTNGTSLTPRGTYSGATTYSLNDVVLNQNSSWVYINATPGAGNAPPTLPTTSNSYWQLVAQKGMDGSGAVNSVNGITGDVIIPQKTVQVFTASGAWSKPIGCRYVRVRAVGGGGGGGGVVAAASQCAVGGGGAGGSYAEGTYDVTSTSSLTVTIGAGGTAGAGTGANGGGGGQSSFGGLLTAPGGGGGGFMATGTAVTTAAGGASGNGGTGGSINAQGNDGGLAIRVSGAGGLPGFGGHGPFGGSGRPPNGAGTGRNATAPGGGGGGAYSLSATGFAGGTGADGIVIVEEYY